MQVILLERVAKLGQMGDVVDVKPGFARNYLLLQGKALTASKENIAAFEGQKADLEARNLETRKEAEAVADKLGGEQFIVIRQASDGGNLYGSVTTRDASEVCKEAGFSVDRKQVIIREPIKELGLHEVELHLHPEVITTITLNVARSPEEAELQASGRSIQDAAAEEEAQAEFEIAELFDDLGAAQLDELETEAEQATDQPAVQEKEELDEKLDDDK
ncbi:50S ribosomal protein L9 [Roseivivax sp. THAF40]|uniref:50S ribosomal protein L9 n=1 Tax=unclassified Roseivivax TaxID=2639302 RepID=UPI001267A129|nr:MULTISPECIES: 50S ribosomal protein L9 [unclassified Roseivivax]QFS82741.1 50S ribosomal protein L9 [Roseivivax sp. THAF197b]QFT46510.1 50S ribosomal protein L9 [Roseivivax sp. THAF40]